MHECNRFIDYTDHLFDDFSDLKMTMYKPVHAMANILGRDFDQTLFAIGFLSAITTGVVISLTKNVALRRLISSGVALFIGFYVFGARFLAVSAYQMVAYLSMLILPRNVQHLVTISISVLMTLLVHIYLYQIRDNQFGIASHLMASFVRQYVISLNYYDGGADPAKLTSREQQYALKQIPSFLDYFGYNFFVGTVVCGPFIEFKTFTDWLHLRGQFKDVPTLGQIPTLMRRFAVGIICIFTAAKLSQYINFDHMESAEFATECLLHKMLYLIGSI